MPKQRKSRRKGQLPKGAYRLPTGGYVHRSSAGNGLAVIGIVRDEPDLHKIARAVIELAGVQLLKQQGTEPEQPDRKAA